MGQIVLSERPKFIYLLNGFCRNENTNVSHTYIYWHNRRGVLILMNAYTVSARFVAKTRNNKSFRTDADILFSLPAQPIYLFSVSFVVFFRGHAFCF